MILNGRLFFATLVAGFAAWLTGCASLHQVRANVTSYGDWPADKIPGPYIFDRLPSQQAALPNQQKLEAAAAQALTRAGFKPATEGIEPAFKIELNARIERRESSRWDDPFWTPSLHGAYAPRWPWFAPDGTRSLFVGPGVMGEFYEREVTVLIRNAGNSKPLFETRATTRGSSASDQHLTAALFDAAMAEFPHPQAQTHSVTVEQFRAP